MISVIFPAYNEENNIRPLYQRLRKVAEKINGHSFEIIFVDDCSSDKTPTIIRKIIDQDHSVKMIRFARNCGSHAAIAAGLREMKGDCAIVLAADLQDSPDVIIDLVDRWQKGAELVWGVRDLRKGESFLTRLFSRSYYRLMNSLTAMDLPPNGADIFLADKLVVESYRLIKEKNTSIFLTLAWLGFRQESITYVKDKRFSGKSKWTLRKKIKLTVDSLLSFSDVLIRAISLAGILTAFLGFCYAGFIFRNFMMGTPVQGWSSLMVAILVIGGIVMIMLGILGEYLWRTYDETRGRPHYVIEYKAAKESKS